MEITTEIMKTFGQEMAKLFSGKITEEELENQAAEVWTELTEHSYRYGERQKSQLEKLIEEEITNKVIEKVREMLKAPRCEEMVKKEAEEIVLGAREKAAEMLTERLAQGIAEAPFLNYNIIEAGSIIAGAIANR